MTFIARLFYFLFVFLRISQRAICFQPLSQLPSHDRTTERILSSSIQRNRRRHSTFSTTSRRQSSLLWLSSTSSSSPSSPSSSSAAAAPPSSSSDLNSLSVREIKAELKAGGVTFSDCFDKESLLKRLKEFREGVVTGSTRTSATETADNESEAENKENARTTTSTTGTSTSDASSNDENESTASAKKEIDPDTLVEEIRAMRVKELREELARRNLRWAGMLEKEDLVQAVLAARLKAAEFSVTGLVSPGQVADLTGDQVEQELASSVGPLLLLDAYAVWCGPCKLMSATMAEVAALEELRDKVRFVKMDTDNYPTQATNWRVQGLPTLILFDNNGKEMSRIEGALMKDQLVQWIKSNGNI